jgi:hypothetical protein
LTISTIVWLFIQEDQLGMIHGNLKSRVVQALVAGDWFLSQLQQSTYIEN